MTVKELMNFLSNQNQDAKVTLTKAIAIYYTGPDDRCEEEPVYEDKVTDLKPCCLTVDVLGNGDVDIRWL